MSRRRKYYDDCAYAKPDYYAHHHKKEREEMCVLVPKVIGRDKTEELVEAVIDLPDCDGGRPFEIVDVLREVELTLVEVCKDKVLINGYLRKNVIYKTKRFDCVKDKTMNEYPAAYGDVRHTTVWIPFKTFVNVPGARVGDEYVVEYAGVQDGCYVEQPIYADDPTSDIKWIDAVREKDVITVDIKVVRPVQVTIDKKKKNICP